MLHYTIRILLIDHVFPKTLDELLRDNRMRLGDYLNRDVCHNLFFNNSQPLDLDTINDRDTIIPLILREAAGESVDDKSVDGALKHLKSMEKQGAWHPLFAILIGYTLRKAHDDSQSIDVTAWNRRQLIEHYLTKSTRLPWKLKKNRVNGTYASAFIAVATARRGVNFRFLKQYKPDHPLAASVKYNQVKELCRNIVSAPNIPDKLPPFEPDILGETFFLLFLEAMQEDEDLLGAFKKPFIAMLSEGNEAVLLNDALEFIGFITRLTRNLCTDDQNDPKVEAHWQTLTTFLNPKDFPSNSLQHFAVSASLLECTNLIEKLHPQERKKEFDLFLQQIAYDIDIKVFEVFSSHIFAGPGIWSLGAS